MITLRPASARGRTQIGWLNSAHTFSFGQWHNPSAMGFRTLRVINDDRVTPKAGFPTHGHRDMEILSVVVEGELAHKDSMGNGSIIRPGEVQLMSAGTGVTHSEFNNTDGPLRFLQIWLPPAQRGLTPSYDQRAFPAEERAGRLRLMVSPDGAEGSVRIHQDARIYGGHFEEGQSASYRIPPGRHAYVQVVRGRVQVAGKAMVEGDGLEVSGESGLGIEGVESADILVFDLA